MSWTFDKGTRRHQNTSEGLGEIQAKLPLGGMGKEDAA